MIEHSIKLGNRKDAKESLTNVSKESLISLE